MMTGQLQPDSGTVTRGETVKIGVFAQENEEWDENQRVLDYIRDVAEYVPTVEDVYKRQWQPFVDFAMTWQK